MSQEKTKSNLKNSILPFILISPTIIIVALFTVWPTILSVYQSLFRQRLNMAEFRVPKFVGLQNYISLFSSQTFHQVLLNTFLYVAITVPVSIFLALLFALLVNRSVKGIGFARLALFYPTILPMVSAATIWMFFFTPEYGLFNTFLKFFGYRGPQDWAGNPHLALLAMMIIFIWKSAGYFMIFYLAGLQNLPESVLEAAAIDGANPFQTLIHIIFPLLRRTTLFVTTIAFLDAFQIIDHIVIITKGGPSDATNILLYYLWQLRFEYTDIGKSSALTVILIAIMLLFTITNFVLSERREEKANAK
jgi:sn-glycerol 3-phosphate transport system permease protein